MTELGARSARRRQRATATAWARGTDAMASGLLLVNARIRTPAPASAGVEAVACRGGIIVAVGSNAAARAAAPADATIIDGTGTTIVPGFIDPHVHLAALAAALGAVDCSTARSVEAIVATLREAAATTPPGAWIRAAGYDERRLVESRHPTRWDLDRATTRHPVRLLHRSGHALVLNSRAMALAGITIASAEPPGGVIERRLSDGEPTGLLLEMNDALSGAVPPLPRAGLVAGMRGASALLLQHGVTAVQDMTHTNDATAAAFLASLAAESGFAPRLLPPATAADGGGALVKVMVRETGDRPHPDAEALAALIRARSRTGQRLAVHAVERRTVTAVVEAYERAGVGRAGLRHRIEHAGICPPDLARRSAALGLVVVSNPVFLWERGDVYRRTVAERDLPHLYAVGDLVDAGVTVAAASDAPVARAGPLAGLAAAVSRRSATGAALPSAGLAADQALDLYTTAAAVAAGVADTYGALRAGRPADLVVLRGEPGSPDAVAEMTIICGRICWARWA
ncbi:MAG: amidohydrolase family protein [Dehalococcoidia bacterium]